MDNNSKNLGTRADRQMSPRRALLIGVMAAAAFSGLPAHASGPADGPVTLIVPFAPGGNLDITARAIVPAFEKALGRSVVVENKPGAGGSIGAALVARAPADGRTLLVTAPNAIVVLPEMIKTQYRLADFRPVGVVSVSPLVLVVPAASPYKTVQDLMAAARSRPGKISAGHAGMGTSNNVALMRFAQAADLSINEIAYKGSGPALTDLMGGQIDMAVDQLSSSHPHIKSGKLRALAVLSAKREAALPDVPTLREAGLQGFEASTTAGIIAPAATSDAVIQVLNRALVTALADATIKAKFISMGGSVMPTSAAEYQAMLVREAASAQMLAKAGKFSKK